MENGQGRLPERPTSTTPVNSKAGGERTRGSRSRRKAGSLQEIADGSTANRTPLRGPDGKFIRKADATTDDVVADAQLRAPLTDPSETLPPPAESAAVVEPPPTLVPSTQYTYGEPRLPIPFSDTPPPISPFLTVDDVAQVFGLTPVPIPPPPPTRYSREFLAQKPNEFGRIAREAAEKRAATTEATGTPTEDQKNPQARTDSTAPAEVNPSQETQAVESDALAAWKQRVAEKRAAASTTAPTEPPTVAQQSETPQYMSLKDIKARVRSTTAEQAAPADEPVETTEPPKSPYMSLKDIRAKVQSATSASTDTPAVEPPPPIAQLAEPITTITTPPPDVIPNTDTASTPYNTAVLAGRTPTEDEAQPRDRGRRRFFGIGRKNRDAEPAANDTNAAPEAQVPLQPPVAPPDNIPAAVVSPDTTQAATAPPADELRAQFGPPLPTPALSPAATAVLDHARKLVSDLTIDQLSATLRSDPATAHLNSQDRLALSTFLDQERVAARASQSAAPLPTVNDITTGEGAPTPRVDVVDNSDEGNPPATPRLRGANGTWGGNATSQPTSTDTPFKAKDIIPAVGIAAQTAGSKVKKFFKDPPKTLIGVGVGTGLGIGKRVALSNPNTIPVTAAAGATGGVIKETVQQAWRNLDNAKLRRAQEQTDQLFNDWQTAQHTNRDNPTNKNLREEMKARRRYMATDSLDLRNKKGELTTAQENYAQAHTSANKQALKEAERAYKEAIKARAGDAGRYTASDIFHIFSGKDFLDNSTTKEDFKELLAAGGKGAIGATIGHEFAAFLNMTPAGDWIRERTADIIGGAFRLGKESAKTVATHKAASTGAILGGAEEGWRGRHKGGGIKGHCIRIIRGMVIGGVFGEIGSKMVDGGSIQNPLGEFTPTPSGTISPTREAVTPNPFRGTSTPEPTRTPIPTKTPTSQPGFYDIKQSPRGEDLVAKLSTQTHGAENVDFSLSSTPVDSSHFMIDIDVQQQAGILQEQASYIQEQSREAVGLFLQNHPLHALNAENFVHNGILDANEISRKLQAVGIENMREDSDRYKYLAAMLRLNWTDYAAQAQNTNNIPVDFNQIPTLVRLAEFGDQSARDTLNSSFRMMAQHAIDTHHDLYVAEPGQMLHLVNILNKVNPIDSREILHHVLDADYSQIDELYKTVPIRTGTNVSLLAREAGVRLTWDGKKDVDFLEVLFEKNRGLFEEGYTRMLQSSPNVVRQLAPNGQVLSQFPDANTFPAFFDAVRNGEVGSSTKMYEAFHWILTHNLDGSAASLQVPRSPEDYDIIRNIIEGKITPPEDVREAFAQAFNASSGNDGIRVIPNDVTWKMIFEMRQAVRSLAQAA